MADALLAHTLEEGQGAIDSFATHSVRLAELLPATFPAKPLEAVAAEMKPAIDKNPTVPNATCAKLAEQVREEAAIAVAAFRAAEMWLRIKAPSVSDGNNFGVDVQNYVIAELQAMRTAMEAFIPAARDYHWSRAEGLAKLISDSATAETSTSESKETKDGKTEDVKKSSKTSTTKEAKPAGYQDYAAYVLGLDVKQYHTAYTSLTDIKNNYLKAHLLFAKNMKRLADPRGEGEDGFRGAHAMSMF